MRRTFAIEKLLAEARAYAWLMGSLIHWLNQYKSYPNLYLGFIFYFLIWECKYVHVDIYIGFYSDGLYNKSKNKRREQTKILYNQPTITNFIKELQEKNLKEQLLSR